MEYEVWYRRENDGRAPEAICLSDYDYGGTVEASSPKEIMSRSGAVSKSDDDPDDFSNLRKLKSGDVIIRDNNAWILTPMGIIASIFIIPEESS